MEANTTTGRRGNQSIACGEYLFTIAADCAGCHSRRDLSKLSAPVISRGCGRGLQFPKEMGLPGEVVAPNITPDVETGIGAWTDGENIRAIREGIGRNGPRAVPDDAVPRLCQDERQRCAIAGGLHEHTDGDSESPSPDKARLPRQLSDRRSPGAGSECRGGRSEEQAGAGRYVVTLGGNGACHNPMERGATASRRIVCGR